MSCLFISPIIHIYDISTAPEDAAAVIAQSEASKKTTSTSNQEDSATQVSTRAGFNTRPKFWRQLLLTLLGIVETFGWSLALVSLAKKTSNANSFDVTRAVVPLVSWVYGTLRPNLRPSCTPYYDLFTLYLAYFLAACLALYESLISGEIGFTPARLFIILDIFLTLGGLVLISGMPLNTVESREDQDVCSLCFLFKV